MSQFGDIAEVPVSEIAFEEHRAVSRVDQPTTPAAALTAMGIVYGDLGTSPLYTLQAVAEANEGGLPAAALGALSLIFWLLIVTISIKYCLFVMRADNHGEGGILALMSFTGASWHGRGRALIVMGLFGAALIYGDGVITPAISVLSALEGLNQATDVFKPHVMPMAVVVLLALFTVQNRGTARIGNAFGPIMLIWFIAIAVLGVGGIVLVELRARALIIAPDQLFTAHSKRLAELALQHALPAIYEFRQFVAAGGLISYGSSETEYYLWLDTAPAPVAGGCVVGRCGLAWQLAGKHRSVAKGYVGLDVSGGAPSLPHRKAFQV